MNSDDPGTLRACRMLMRYALICLFACAPKPAMVQPELAIDLSEPPPRPPIAFDPLDCARAVPMAPDDVAACHGVLVGNAMLEEIRLDAADLAFWEDAARACRRYRQTDIALCDGRVAALQTERDDALRDLRVARLASSVALPVGLVAGAALTVLVVYGVDEAER